MSSIEVKGLTFGYGEKPVLKDVSITFDRSELVCILGPNGVGKTTLVKCINRLLKCSGGEVLIDGVDNRDMSLLDLARKLAFVPNSSSSVFSMTVAEAILMGRHPRAGWNTSAEDLRVVNDAMNTLDIQEYASRDIRELSAGQLQRVMIARGLVQEPEILILDEPTSNLDVKHQMTVMKFLKEYARDKNVMVIMVCHDLNITAAYADRVVVMKDGGVYADGKPWDILTAETIKHVYDVSCRVIDVEGTPHIALLPE